MVVVKNVYTYFSQKNNKLDPAISCQCTAMVQALDLLGIPFPAGAHVQPEDNLRQFILDRGRDPEVHAELSKSVNEWIGRDITYFSTQAKICDIKKDILSGLPVVLSGTFPGSPQKRPRPLGHIVTLVGWGTEGALIADPYGDTMNNWNGSGKSVLIDWDRFTLWFKPAGDPLVKWAHRFRA